jgi:hypothetical protein
MDDGYGVNFDAVKGDECAWYQEYNYEIDFDALTVIGYCYFD